MVLWNKSSKMMFTGTNQQQDTRFSDKEKKLLKQMKFGDNLNKRVDMSKVKLDVLRPWISKKITDMLNIEDDVIVEFVYNQLEEEKYPCPKKMQINMTGFLNGKNARVFMEDLWSLLLSAQESESGIPAEFIEQKKEEIMKREEDAKLLDEIRSRKSRSRDRGSRDRGGDRGGGDRGGGGNDDHKKLKKENRAMYKPEPEEYLDDEEKMIEDFIEAEVPRDKPVPKEEPKVEKKASVERNSASKKSPEKPVKESHRKQPEDHSSNRDRSRRKSSRDRSRSRRRSRDRRSSRDRKSSRDRRRSRSHRRSTDRSKKRSRSPRDKRDRDGRPRDSGRKRSRSPPRNKKAPPSEKPTGESSYWSQYY